MPISFNDSMTALERAKSVMMLVSVISMMRALPGKCVVKELR